MIIDTHCHILPGVDDGAKNADETRRMLRMAFKDGIDEIIATPHFNCDMDTSVLEKGWEPICVPVSTQRK